MKKNIGLIVNPIAGMGGSVGLKGTDGELYRKALDLGAEPVTPARTEDLLAHVKRRGDLTFLVAPGEMGEAHVDHLDAPYQVVGSIPEETSAEDTKRIARQMVERGIDLLIFVGGDGTARDICGAIDGEVPVVAVPGGVKVFSSVFALRPRAAAGLVDAFVEGADLTEREVLDIDEDAYREDRLDARLYGYLRVPETREHLQPGKVPSSHNRPSEACKKEIAAFVVEEMDQDVLYLLGPGTTVRPIADELGLPKTLLGVDAVHDGELVGEDLNEAGILGLFERYDERRIVVTPIGGNGFIFGRGNKQFTPRVLEEVGRENVIIVATRNKLRGLACLRVDTGDAEVDRLLCGYTKVIVGYKEGRMMEVRC